MPRQVLSDKRVQSAQPPKTGRLELPDALEPGLALRITSDDRRSWAVRVRSGAERVQRRITFGHPRERDGSPVLTLAEARKGAREIKQAAAEGRPLTVRDGMKGAATFAETVESYLCWAKANQRPRTYGETARILRHGDLAGWRERPAKAISAADVRLLRDEVTKRAPVMATRVLRKVSGWGTWAVNEGKITTSPAAGVRKITPEKDRDRILNLSEVAAFVPACESIGYPFGMVALLLLLTGQRLREVANMEWSEVDLDARLWTLPAERAKNGRENHIHLSAPALAILKAIAAERDKIEVRRNAMLVFTHVGVPISGYDDLKGRLDREMAREMGRQVEPFTLHDLRRSAASIMAACKVPPHIVERVLNHTGGTISGVAAIYNKHTYREETAEALDKLAEYVTTATAPEVIIMRGQARALTHA